MIPQRTIRSPIQLEGHGIHTNRKVTVTIRPASPDHGITFVRTDLKKKIHIAAHASAITATQLNTALGRGEHSIGTVEHLLAALSGMNVDNALIEVDGPEVPILDGSSYPFVVAMEKVGYQDQLAPRRFIVIDRPIEIGLGESMAQLSPAPFFSIDCMIEFPHPMIAKQRFEAIMTPKSFAAEISAARTFGFLHEAEELKARGLGLGASLENCVVLDAHRILNREGLRYPNEFVRHKLLDALGDISLLGYPLLGKLTTYKGGHTVHSRLIEAVTADATAWHIAKYEINPRALYGSKPYELQAACK